MSDETPNCVICMEISVTMTDCNHPLCRACYKKMDDLPAYQYNMKKCPYCRKTDPKMKDVEIELTDEQKLEHYNTLMEYYREHTAIVPKAAGRPPAPVPERPPVRGGHLRIPEGQGLRPEPPRPLHPLAMAAADGAAGRPVPAPVVARVRRGVVLRLTSPATYQQDLVVMNGLFDVRKPAPVSTQVQLGEGMKMKDVPFNCRPMGACYSCRGKMTRRCCVRCGDQYVCAECNLCDSPPNDAGVRGGCREGSLFHHCDNWSRV